VLHVCYCHTPFRYSWYARQEGLDQVPSPLRPLLGRTLNRVREWDRGVAQRPTVYVANSRLTQSRIREFWGRETAVVHPPVEVGRFSPGEPEDFFLIVGELVLHKNVEVALEAARNARVPIKVVGTGADERRLKALHGDHAEFLGRVDDETLADLYARTRALLLPAVEEFGITAVEAQAAGRPVIAANGGGALETVVAGETGLFAPVRDADALAKALLDPALDDFDPNRATENAQRFSVANFQRALAAQIEAARSRPARS
jgi:glycosyltransferase involved in cell wall biosynthesis